MAIRVWWLGWYRRWNAAREGRIEGRQNKPPREQTIPSEFEKNIKNEIEAIIYAVVKGWTDADDRLFRQYCGAERDRENTENEIGRLQGQCKELKKAYDDNQKIVDDSGGLLYLNKPAYYVIIAVLFLLEIPVNYTVMQILGLDPILTAIVTAGPAAILVFGAHFTGITLKSGKDRFSRLGPLALAVAILTLVILTGIAYLREEFIAQFGEQLLGIHLNRTVITITFATLNLVLFLVGVLASYLAHDQIIEKFLKAKAAFTACAAKMEQRRRYLEQLLVRLAQLKAERIKLFESHRATEGQFKNEGQLLMGIYRKANARARQGDPPEYFKGPLTAIDRYMPEEIGWDCHKIAPVITVTVPSS